MNQRRNEIVIGGTSPTAARPATELPAQHAEAKISIATASQRGMAARGAGGAGLVTGASAGTIGAAATRVGSSHLRDDDRPTETEI